MQRLKRVPQSSQAKQLFLCILVFGQILALAFIPALNLNALAQVVGSGTSTSTGLSQNHLIAQQFVAPERVEPTTILPTDVVPLPTTEQRMTLGENLQLRVLQKLPARFYFNLSAEASFRDETNPYQYPTKRQFIQRFMPPPPEFRELPILRQITELSTLSQSDINNAVFRILPNVSAGWTLTPTTRFFGNYFLIRDSLMHSVKLNTTIQSVAYGLQQDIPITRRGNLQAEFQVRSLYQLAQKPAYDFLPALTYSFILTPRTVVFANALFQLRGNGYYQCPTREMAPFYTFGGIYQKGSYAFTANATFVQNFRHMFGRHALIPIDNYSWILDFEIARRLFASLPGLQAFMRAEPIYNYHSHQTPGLAGMDFRMFWGLRMAMGKPPLTAALEQIREQLEGEEGAPPPTPGGSKPSAYIQPYDFVAQVAQPIHGHLTSALVIADSTGDEPCCLSSIHGAQVESNLLAASQSGSDLMFAKSNSAFMKTVCFTDSLKSVPVAMPLMVKAHSAVPGRRQADMKILIATAFPEESRKPCLAIETRKAKEDTVSLVKHVKPVSKIESKTESKTESKMERKMKTRVRTVSQAKSPSQNPRELQMVLFAPLPVVKADSKTNPFPESGSALQPPLLINHVR